MTGVFVNTTSIIVRLAGMSRNIVGEHASFVSITVSQYSLNSLNIKTLFKQTSIAKGVCMVYFLITLLKKSIFIVSTNKVTLHKIVAFTIPVT